ncbi:hypothetical protein DFJ74DRAFT_675123 [Hyaloraphidium curvatum]|nr:hypothetical protein DFJ74DRAFT_675123 [Hyaloraphidium curvatum]
MATATVSPSPTGTSTPTGIPSPTPAPTPSTWQQYQSLFFALILVVLFLAYHAYLLYVLRVAPHRTVMGVTKATRKIWAAELMMPPSSPSNLQQIVAVHTLRNMNMSNTMMASACVAITFGMTSWVSALSKASAESIISFLGGSGSLDEYKIVAIIFLYMAAFFCFTQSARYLNHFEFLVTPPLSELDLAYLSCGDDSERKLENTMRKISSVKPNPVSAGRILNVGGAWYSAGQRFVYATFPVILWFFGDIAFLVSGLCLLPLMFVLDFVDIGLHLKQK